MSHHSDEDDGFAGDLFGAESDDDVVQVAPSFEVYERELASTSDLHRQLKIKLVGSHPLWAHHLWNASKVFASLVAAINGATKVVVTDYPDKDLIENIEFNVKQNTPDLNVQVEGYIWGTNTDKLKEALPSGQTTYDVIILSDLIFNHSQHHAMLKTCRELLTPHTGRVYVFYTHHRPQFAERDVQFFSIAQRPVVEGLDDEDRDLLGYGFNVDNFLTRRMGVMFEEDPGDEEVRATVHGWQMWLPYVFFVVPAKGETY